MASSALKIATGWIGFMRRDGGQGFRDHFEIVDAAQAAARFRDAGAHALLQLFQRQRRDRGARDPALVGFGEVDAGDIFDLSGQPSVGAKPVTKSSRSVGLAIMTAWEMPLYSSATGISRRGALSRTGRAVGVSPSAPSGS